MAKKLGLYICSGCSIGDTLDTEKLLKTAVREIKPADSCLSPCLCGAEAVAAIKDAIAQGKVDGLVLGACSPRVKNEVFSFDGIVTERVNLREHVAWCHAARDEDTQALAEDYLRMGAVKAQKSEVPVPMNETIARKLLVVGGGITGVTAALEAADAGYEVVLVEKEPQLGGFLGGLKSRFPTTAPYDTPVPDGTAMKIDAVTYHSKIQVLTSAKVVKTEGQPGMFEVTIEAAGNTTRITAGSIVLATGWKPYDASRLGHLGYGSSPDVVTNVEFERMAAEGRLVRPSDGKPINSAVFVQCAGSRDKDHLSYCSSVCCVATLKHLTYLRGQNPDAQLYVIYKDMRATGLYERFYRSVQDDPLNFFTKGEVASVQPEGGKLLVTVDNTLFGEAVQLECDLVVLATGMVPNSADGEAIRALEEAETRAVKSESEAQRADAARKAEELKCHKGTEILGLTYRQGPDLPVLRNGFSDSHFICFPYETRRTGIYSAGAVRAPMDSLRAQEDAAGAALKAIQSIEMATNGQAVHPRAGDTSIPSFFLQRCTQCKRCTEECPFGAIDEDEKGTPKPNPYRCRRCGICMGACPERIISFKNYSPEIISSIVKAVEVPEEDEEKPRVLMFICENDAYPALDIAGFHHMQYDPGVRVIPLRCLGSLNIVWIADALSRGIDGVMLVGCKFGDDYQCHFIRGSELANRRLENVKETLQRLRLEPERLQLTELSINEWAKLPVLINSFMDRIREIGPNPYKGF